MAKRVMLWARVEDETAAKLDEIVATSAGDRSDHIRQALAEYIARKQVAGAMADRLMMVADGEMLNQV